MNVNDDRNTVQRGMYAGGAPAGWADTAASPLETETAAGPWESYVVGGAILSASAIWDEDQGITFTVTRDADDLQEIGALSPAQAERLIYSLQELLKVVSDLDA